MPDTTELHPEQKAIIACQEALAAAHAAKAAFGEGIAAARAAVADARAARQHLVQAVHRGDRLTPGGAAKAALVVADAEAFLGVLLDAEAGFAQPIADAEAELAAATRAEADRRWRLAVARRIAIAERVDRAAAELGNAYDDWLASGDELCAVWKFGRPPETHEIENLQAKNIVAFAIPAALQQHVVYAGTVNFIPLAPRTRANWAGYDR